MRSQYLRSFFHFFSANFIARFVSLIREMLLAWIIGPSKILDIFFFLIAIPEFINQIWNRPLETILLKQYEIDLVAEDALIHFGGGDARRTLNLLEITFQMAKKEDGLPVYERGSAGA